MADGENWTEDEVTLALGVYLLKLLKGTTSSKQESDSDISEQLAGRLNRTPGAVSFKVGNLKNVATKGKQGLKNVGKTDRAVWNKYFDSASSSLDIKALASGIRSASQNLGISRGLCETIVNGISQTNSIEFLQDPEDQPQPASQSDTDKEQTFNVTDGKTYKIVVARRKQSVFRKFILGNFDGKCAISGLDEPRLLEAAHIRPWSEFEEGRVDIRNGIALNVLLHKAYDANLLGIDETLRVWISPALKKEPYFAAFDGKTIPIKQSQIAPLPEYLAKRFEEFQRACSEKES